MKDQSQNTWTRIKNEVPKGFSYQICIKIRTIHKDRTLYTFSRLKMKP